MNMKRRINSVNRENLRFWAFLGLALLCLTSCGNDRFTIRLAPNSQTCIESLLSTRNEIAMPGGKLADGLALKDIQALAFKPENLAKAVGNRRYILHFHRKNAEFDEEISPIKFPFYWEIDSTKLQTEGIYRIEIKSETDLHMAFYCKHCQVITPDGKREAGKKPEIENDFESGIQAKHCNEDACFAIRPRKLDLSPEVGKTYLIKVEAQQTYLDSAKIRLLLEESTVLGNYVLRFEDPLGYRASTFVKDLGIAIALSDKTARERIILPRIDQLQARIDSIEISKAYPVTGSRRTEQPPSDLHVALERERVQLQMEAISVLPRILVISPGMRCGEN
mgnify:CR=1 FL=1